ncbi:MAG: hypothetical protein JW757_13380 [Anaerolineales bacterium]|nr:hypothetical protein [Anaerolineales bacterium]
MSKQKGVFRRKAADKKSILKRLDAAFDKVLSVLLINNPTTQKTLTEH